MFGMDDNNSVVSYFGGNLDRFSVDVPVVRYVIEHLDGKLSIVYASEMEKENGFLKFYRCNGEFRGGSDFIFRRDRRPKYVEHREIGSVREIRDSEQVGFIDLFLTFNSSTNNVLDQDLDGEYPSDEYM
jgi:hypothetical protein